MLMNEEKKLNAVLDAVAEFERDWYCKHPYGKYVAEHWDEYQREKKKFVDAYMRSAEEAW